MADLSKECRNVMVKTWPPRNFGPGATFRNLCLFGYRTPSGDPVENPDA